MPTLEVNNFNIVLSVLGGWLSLFGLVSYLCKEHFYLSEACEFWVAGPELDARRLVPKQSCKATRLASVPEPRRNKRAPS